MWVIERWGSSSAVSAEGQSVNTGIDSSGVSHALLWTTTGVVDLNPSGYSSRAVATNGTQQVGVDYDTGTGNNLHAMLWTGTAASAVDLNPTNLGMDTSEALGTNGIQQVGFGLNVGSPGTTSHALLWTGTAASAVDLNPSGFTESSADGTNGTQQVGVGLYGYGYNAQALLWNGTAASAVDLNPTNLGIIQSSAAYGTSGTQQVGAAELGSGANRHIDAMLWTGTAASAVDLNPAYLVGDTRALATNGTQQVGIAQNIEDPNGLPYAMLWTGTAESAVDLQTLLPSTGTWTQSQADSIDSCGDVYGTADGTFNGASGYFAVEWTPTLTWNNAGGSGDGLTWDTAGNQNWNDGTAPTVYADGKSVLFNDSNNGNYTVTLNTTVNPAWVTVNSTGNYTISGTGSIAGSGSLTKMGSSTLTLSTVNTYTGGTIVNAGTLVVGVNGALPNSSVSITGGTLQLGASTGLAQMTSLSITGNGTLDINNNHVIITYGSGPDPIATIAAEIESGYNGGAWNGPGIISSAAQTSTNGLRYGIGYADGSDFVVFGLLPGQIELQYTLLGDANLDGVVNGEDFTILVSNIGKSAPTSGGIDGSGWDHGDFNYDGVVNGIDFTELVANLGKSANGADVILPAADYAAIDAFAAANGLMADVPEPTFFGLLGLAAAGVLARRRRTA
jgi:autotransporter-associated beta strand protein